MSRLRKSMEEYGGLHIGCAPGTHLALANEIFKHTAERSGLLDIGAHSGALLARFRDNGFSDLMGIDLDETRFSIKGAKFLRIDLNRDFAEEVGRDFSVITATDVIEHLDNPRHFLTELWKIMRKDGLLGLSFPNIAFWEGRIKFMLRGEHWGFGEKNYRKQRHISPMTHDQSRLMLSELGFNVVAQFTAGSFATPLRNALFAPLWMPLRAIGGPAALGESTIIIARKSDRDVSLKVPEHYKSRWEGRPDRIGLDA